MAAQNNMNTLNLNPKPNAAICCAACGIPVLPSIRNRLVAIHSRTSLEWQRPVLLRPEVDISEQQPGSSPRARHHAGCGNDKHVSASRALFIGGGDGFRLPARIPASDVTDYGVDSATGDVLRAISDGTRTLVVRQVVVFSDVVQTNSKGKKRSSSATAAAAAAAAAPIAHLAVPLHEGCHQLVSRFCQYQSRFSIDFRAAGGGAPSSLAHFWELWQQRILVTAKPIPTPRAKVPAAVQALPLRLFLSQIFRHMQGTGALPAQMDGHPQLQLQTALGLQPPQLLPPPPAPAGGAAGGTAAGAGASGAGPGAAAATAAAAADQDNDADDADDEAEDDDKDDDKVQLVPLDRPIFEPHNYMGAPYILTLDDYAKMLLNDTLPVTASRWDGFARFQADPMCPRRAGRPSVTEQVVMRHLDRIGRNLDNDSHVPEDAEVKAVLARVAKLPRELQGLVEEQMEPFVNESLHCTRAYAPLWWRTKLFEGHLIPWLWDLDFQEVRQERIALGIADPDDEEGWDWELLVRQLSQASVFEEGGLLRDDKTSLGLWNRHRIWQLCDKARLGHLAHVAPPFSANYKPEPDITW